MPIVKRAVLLTLCAWGSLAAPAGAATVTGTLGQRIAETPPTDQGQFGLVAGSMAGTGEAGRAARATGEAPAPERRFVLRGDDGRTYPLGDDQPGALLGKHVAVEDRSAQPGLQGVARAANGQVAAGLSPGARSAVGSTVSPSPSRAAGYTGLGSHKVAVVLVNFSDNRARPFTADALRSRYFTGSDSVGQFFSDQTGGALTFAGRDRADGDVYDWIELPIASTGCPENAVAEGARAAVSAAGGSLDGYDHVSYFFPYTGACAYGGLADVSGPESWINGYSQTGLIAHELGHNMGAGHAQSIRCTRDGVAVAVGGTCTTTEYGDIYDAMGGSNQRFFSGWRRQGIGHLAGGQETITGSGRYSLVSVNGSAPGTKVLMIPRRSADGESTSAYAVEIRTPLPRFEVFAGNFAAATTGVTIRIVPSDPEGKGKTQIVDTTPATQAVSDAPLQPGATFTDPDFGITIFNEASGNGAATLQVTAPAVSVPPTPTPTPTPPPSTIPVGQADGIAPTAPANPRIQRIGTRARITWEPATDNVGVAYYQVIREGVGVGSTTSLAFERPESAVSVTYAVDAVDAAGNRTRSSPVSLGPDLKPSPPGGTGSGGGTNSGGDTGTGGDTGPGNGSGATGDGSAATGVGIEVRSPKARGGKLRVPAGGRITFRTAGASELRVKVNGRTVKRKGTTVTYVVPARLRKAGTLTLRVTVVVGGKSYARSFRVSKGVITAKGAVSAVEGK